MSDTNQGVASSESDESTCPTLPKSTRLLAYYVQSIVGIILMPFSLGRKYLLISGILLLLTSSLWVMKPMTLFKQLINPVRFVSFIILVGAIVLCIIIGTPFNYVLCGVSFWYFLSFIPGGQEWCKNCLSGCCNNCNKSDSKNENFV